MKFIFMLKELIVNIHLIKALEKMPRDAKFMKYLVTNKRTVNYKDVGGLYHCSAITSQSLVQKKVTQVPSQFFA